MNCPILLLIFTAHLWVGSPQQPNQRNLNCYVCFTPVVYAYCLHLQTKSSRTKQKQCQPSQFILPASHCTLAADGLNATVAGGRRRGRCRRQELTREGGRPHLTRPAPAPRQSQRLLAAAASLQDIVGY